MRPEVLRTFLREYFDRGELEGVTLTVEGDDDSELRIRLRRGERVCTIAYERAWFLERRPVGARMERIVTEVSSALEALGR